MGKDKYYTYECIWPVEIIFVAGDHRRERWPLGTLQPPMTEHTFRFSPEEPLSERPADYLVTNRPIAAHFTESITKVVKRWDSLDIGKRKRVNVKTTTRPKFQLLEPNEVQTHPKRRVLYLDLREVDYAPAPAPKVEKAVS